MAGFGSAAMADWVACSTMDRALDVASGQKVDGQPFGSRLHVGLYFIGDVMIVRELTSHFEGLEAILEQLG